MICFHLDQQIQPYFLAGPPNPKKYFYHAALSEEGTRKAIRLIVSLLFFDVLSQYSTQYDTRYQKQLSYSIRCITDFLNSYKKSLRYAANFSKILHPGWLCYLCRGPPCFDAPYPKPRCTASKQEE